MPPSQFLSYAERFQRKVDRAVGTFGIFSLIQLLLKKLSFRRQGGKIVSQLHLTILQFQQVLHVLPIIYLPHPFFVAPRDLTELFFVETPYKIMDFYTLLVFSTTFSRDMISKNCKNNCRLEELIVTFVHLRSKNLIITLPLTSFFWFTIT